MTQAETQSNPMTVTPADLARLSARNAAVEWAQIRMARRDFVIVDTETTDIKDADGKALDMSIVQITIVNAWGKVCFSSLIRPVEPINEEGMAFKTHGIGNVMLRHAPLFKHCYAYLRGYLSQSPVAIAYSSDFDSGVINAECARAERDKIVTDWHCAKLKYAAFVGDPGKYGKGYKWHKLKGAVAALKLPERDWHDASADCLATYDLICALAKEGAPGE